MVKNFFPIFVVTCLLNGGLKPSDIAVPIAFSVVVGCLLDWVVL